MQLTKVDKDYPDNKLTGAEFTAYRDSNGNKELDADDELLGTLTETSTGVYEMPDLIYGGYFVKETKAPEGFYLDENAYYFEITEHGKTVTVENEAGKGFVNAPQVGSLKITKTSSDNKVEGFSFRVTLTGIPKSLPLTKTVKFSLKISALASMWFPRYRTALLPLIFSRQTRRRVCLRALLQRWKCTTSSEIHRKQATTVIPFFGSPCSAFPGWVL